MSGPPPPSPAPHPDPLVTLRVAGGGALLAGASAGGGGGSSSITGVCFLDRDGSGDGAGGASRRLSEKSQIREHASLDGDDDDGGDSDDDGSDDEDREPIGFRCRRLFEQQLYRGARPSPGAPLRGRLLATCHGSGDSRVWDLHQQRILSEFCPNRGGPGLALRRAEEGHCGPRVLYQTRDGRGTVSLHEVRPDGSVCELQSLRTGSRSFCAAAPCASSSPSSSSAASTHLVALPDADETVAVVRDWRAPPASRPAAVIRTSEKGSSGRSAATPIGRRYGMLASLAFAASTASDEAEREGGGGDDDGSGGFSPSSCRPVVACGMESGHVLLYDLAQSSASLSLEGCQQPMASSSSSSSSPTLWLEEPAAEISLGKDPVMALDMVPSRPPSSSPPPGLAGVAVAAGLAGTPEDVAALDPADRGRVALLRCERRDGAWTARVRSRFETCKLPASPAGAAAGGKPGVSLCRFRPGAGRLVAVAGWDRRVRVFDRSSAADPLLALLRGHAATVTALDWAADAEASGLVATGGGDGRINVWKLDL